eukprot:39028-Eustigmatos_ZCMA.PRE.2
MSIFYWMSLTGWRRRVRLAINGKHYRVKSTLDCELCSPTSGNPTNCHTVYVLLNTEVQASPLEHET